MSYKFNNGNGCITCDSCGAIMVSPITFPLYRDSYPGYDFCETCSSKMTVVDNFDRIEKILEFNNRDEFYFLQIIQRKKDGNITQIGNNGYRTVKTYYIFSKEQFQRKREKITELCISNNARAYIHLNRRNAREVALAAITQYAQLVSEDNSYQGYRVYDSACGGTRARGYKPLWVVDIDSKDPQYVHTVIQLINECRGVECNKIKHQIPTLHGYHLITIGFDLQQFQQRLALEKLDPIDIQKDNPTLLYYAKV